MRVRKSNKSFSKKVDEIKENNGYDSNSSDKTVKDVTRNRTHASINFKVSPSEDKADVRLFMTASYFRQNEGIQPKTADFAMV